MGNVNNAKLILTSSIGVIGGFIVNLLGGWDSDIQYLIVFMGIDIVMGLLLATFMHRSNKSSTGTLSSNSMWNGLRKKGISLLIVMVAHQLDSMLGFDFIRTSAIIAFCVNELLSIVENAGLMGAPIPKVITNAIEMLKEKEDMEEETE